MAVIKRAYSVREMINQDRIDPPVDDNEFSKITQSVKEFREKLNKDIKQNEQRRLAGMFYTGIKRHK